MKPLSESRLFAWIVILLLAWLLATAMSVAYAGGTDITQSNDNNAQTTGDVLLSGGENTANNSALVSGSRSYSLAAPGLSDVDIAQCLGSESFSLIVGAKQKLVLNHVCMAEFYMKVGKYDLAAQSLCNQPEILAEYKAKGKSDNAAEADCEAAHDFEPMFHVEPQPAAVEDDDEHDELVQQVAMFEEQIAELTKQVQRPKVTKQVIQQPFLSDDKRARLLAEKSK